MVTDGIEPPILALLVPRPNQLGHGTDLLHVTFIVQFMSNVLWATCILPSRHFLDMSYLMVQVSAEVKSQL